MPTHARQIQVKQDDVRAGCNPGLFECAFPMQIGQGFIPITDHAEVVGQPSLFESALRQAHIPGIIFNQQHG
jgi:hypothetical protein